VKILCPRGHRMAEVTRDGSRWMIDITRAPEYMMLGADGQLTTGTRYPDREPLDARPRRQLACPRECAREYSWYQAESADLDRLAAAGLAEHRITPRT
jgi:hypothetical protein